MSEKTGDLIISLAKQGGVELDEAQTKAIQEIATDLPEGIASKIQSSLFTIESAKANTDIINSLYSDSLDPIDQRLVTLAKDFGLDEGFMHNLKETKSTYKRMDAISKAILDNKKVALEKAAENAPAGDQEELQKEIVKLNTQIASHGDNTITKTDHEDMIEGYEDMLKGNAAAMLALKSNSLFAGQNWAMDVSPEANMATAQGLFSSELVTKGIQLVDDNGTLKLQTKEGKPYFVENKEVTPQDLANTTLAGHKLLKVTDTTNNNKPVNTTTTVTGNGVDASVAGALAQAQGSMDEIGKLQEQHT